MRRGLLGAAACGAALILLGGGQPVATAQTDVDGELTAAEQYMVEIVNRARAEPEAEAARMGIDLNEGPPNVFLGPEPREPLAVNPCLSLAAQEHTRDLFANFSQLPPTHRGSDGRDPTQRATDAGAVFIGGVAENNAWASQGSTKITESSVLAVHRLLFRDFTETFEVVGRGHRTVMLNGTRNEIGMGLRGGVFGGRTASLVTYDLTTTNTLYITGVAFADNVKANQFYNMGEGLGGITITAVPQGGGAPLVTTTARAGGYSLPVPPGTYDVTAAGGGLGAPVQFDDVVVVDRNVKVDVVVAKAYPAPPPRGFALTKGIAKLGKDGAWTLQVKKATLSFGTLGLTPTQADGLVVRIDGTPYFTLADRTAGKDVRKVDAGLGLVRKLAAKDASGNKLTLDLKKGTLVLLMKSAPGFDPSDGDVGLEVAADTESATVTAPAVAGTNPNKMTVGPATGVLVD